MASVARDIGYQVVGFLRKTIAPAVNATGSTVEVGTIPVGAIVLAGASGIYNSVDFDGTTNTISIGFAADSGTSANTSAYASALAIPVTTGNFVVIDETAASRSRKKTVDTSITASWIGSATTGSLDVVIAYVTDRDR